jgi:hypothetical protein
MIKLCQRALILLVLVWGSAWAQSDRGQQPSSENTQQPVDKSQQPGTSPPPAFGQDNPPPRPIENPPLSGLDEPVLEPTITPRSFLLPGLEISESADSNIAGQGGNFSIHSVTRAMGSLTLQRLWSRYDTALNYVAGAAFYGAKGFGANQVHDLNADQKILWRTGQLSLRDSFSYLPEGSFGGGSFGGASGLQLGAGGIGNGFLGGGVFGGRSNFDFFGPGQFGSLGQQPRITNLGVADVVQNLSPRSSVTVAGAYGLMHFTNNNLGLIDSRQVTTQAGYNYSLSRRDQIALVYGYQNFRFPGGGADTFATHVASVLYGHTISGRLNFVIGGGPQLTQTNDLLGSHQHLSASGRAMLRYRFPKASIGLYYDRYDTNGSGFFPGATSDIARVNFERQLGRLWDLYVDVGYTHNKRVQQDLLFGVNSAFYNYGYAGGGLHRQLGRDFSLFMAYQFSDLAFDSSFCTVGTNLIFSTNCSRASQRHVLSFGLDWHPRPIRLD